MSDGKKKDAMSYSSRLEQYEKTSSLATEMEVSFLLLQGKDYPVVNQDALIQARYIASRLDGSSHKWADMVAHRQPPGCKTDREFLRGHCCGNQFEKTPHVGNYYRSIADRAGVDITGKVYMGTLAEYPGDPRAWISGRGDAQRLCEERGWGCEGAVNVKMRERENPPEEVAVADDIVAERVEQRLDEMAPQDAMRVDLAEAAHEVRETLKPHWSK